MADPFRNYDDFFRAVEHIQVDADLLRQLVRGGPDKTVVIDGRETGSVEREIEQASARITNELEKALPTFRGIQSDITAALSATRDTAARAQESARSAEQSTNLAAAAANVYPDAGAGLAATQDGEAFSAPGSDNGSYLILYRNDSGSAVEISRFPGLSALVALISTVSYALDMSGQAASYASRDSASDKRINQLLQTIAYAIDMAAQTARAVPAAYLRALGQTVHVDDQGRVGIGTDTPGAAFDIAGGRQRLRQSQPPAASSAPGLPGERAWDNNYEYRCVAANTWRRIPLQTW